MDTGISKNLFIYLFLSLLLVLFICILLYICTVIKCYDHYDQPFNQINYGHTMDTPWSPWTKNLVAMDKTLVAMTKKLLLWTKNCCYGQKTVAMDKKL